MEEVINDNAININNIDKDDSENNSMNCDTCFYFSLSRSLFFTFYWSSLPHRHIFESYLISEKQEIVDILLPTSIVKMILFEWL